MASKRQAAWQRSTLTGQRTSQGHQVGFEKTITGSCWNYQSMQKSGPDLEMLFESDMRTRSCRVCDSPSSGAKGQCRHGTALISVQLARDIWLRAVHNTLHPWQRFDSAALKPNCRSAPTADSMRLKLHARIRHKLAHITARLRLDIYNESPSRMGLLRGLIVSQHVDYALCCLGNGLPRYSHFLVLTQETRNVGFVSSRKYHRDHRPGDEPRFR
jgi:hypothetical protein